MRILVTNDDGMNAPGLKVAEAIGEALGGEIWTIAPAQEQSGVSHALSYVRAMRIEQMEERRFIVEGTPADCVFAALHDAMKDSPPDLILSGVNRGHNVADDTVYSGTIGAAMEGAMHGIRSIAMSQYYGKPSADRPDQFAAAKAFGAKVCRSLLDQADWSMSGYPRFFNINYPNLNAEDVLGVKATFQGRRPNGSFTITPDEAPNGRRFLWYTHGSGNGNTEAGSDALECMNGFVTVTPLEADMSVREALDGLQSALDHSG